MKCPIEGCKTRGNFDSDTKMFQHVNKEHRGASYTPSYNDPGPEPEDQPHLYSPRPSKKSKRKDL